MDYETKLREMNNCDMLNEKGLKDFVKVLSQEVSKLKCKVINLENDLLQKKMINKSKKEKIINYLNKAKIPQIAEGICKIIDEEL